MRARWMTWAGMIAVAVMLTVAMLAFPSPYVSARGAYSFGKHFLSAMGRTRVGSADNTISCLTFNSMLVMAAIILAIFWNARSFFIIRPSIQRMVRGCGVAMAVAVAGIGFTPFDLWPHVHDRMTHAVILFGVICFALCLRWSHPDFEDKRAKIAWVAVLVSAGVAHALFMALVLQGDMRSRPVYPIMQKLFVFLLVAWAGWQSWLFGAALRRRGG